MQELPKIKTDFLFKNSQDFNQTTHARPQHSIVFIDNISIISVKCFQMVTSWSRHAFFCSTNQAPTLKRAGKVLTHSSEYQFFSSFFKMATSGYDADCEHSES